MLGRLVQKVDFERLLASRSLSRSDHFALHHVPCGPQARTKAPQQPGRTELSTGATPACTQAVDDLPTGLWLGCVVPKRHARRAVTRNLLKRQIRSAFDRHATRLPCGLWLVRLRVGFAVTQFVSARSAALTRAAHAELDLLLARVAH